MKAKRSHEWVATCHLFSSINSLCPKSKVVYLYLIIDAHVYSPNFLLSPRPFSQPAGGSLEIPLTSPLRNIKLGVPYWDHLGPIVRLFSQSSLPVSAHPVFKDTCHVKGPETLFFGLCPPLSKDIEVTRPQGQGYLQHLHPSAEYIRLGNMPARPAVLVTPTSPKEYGPWSLEWLGPTS